LSCKRQSIWQHVLTITEHAALVVIESKVLSVFMLNHLYHRSKAWCSTNAKLNCLLACCIAAVCTRLQPLSTAAFAAPTTQLMWALLCEHSK
jgi:hypothetical protein